MESIVGTTADAVCAWFVKLGIVALCVSAKRSQKDFMAAESFTYLENYFYY